MDSSSAVPVHNLIDPLERRPRRSLTLLQGAADITGGRGYRGVLEFILPIEERLFDLMSDDHVDPKRIVRDCHMIVQAIIRHETLVADISDGLQYFCDKLCVEAPYVSLLSDIVNTITIQFERIRNGTNDRSVTGHQGVRDLLFNVREFVQWYHRRKHSLLQMETERRELDLESVDEQFFGIDLFHDQTYGGSTGFTLVGGLRLENHIGRSLWCKVRVLKEGKAVAHRPGWESWADDLNRYSIVREGGCRDAASLLALIPRHRRVVIDRLELFFPYAALDLESGRHQVDVELSLVDSSNQPLCRHLVSDQISISSRSESRSLPAPHALGLWPCSPIPGDRLSRVQPKVRRLDERTQVLRITFALDLYDRDVDAVIAPLRVECRLFHPEGGLLGAPTSDLADADGTLCASFYLRPRRPVMRYAELFFEVPLVTEDLDPGIYDILCEIVVLLADNRAVCGGVERVRVPLGPLPPAALSLSALSEEDVGVRLVYPSARSNFSPPRER